MSAFRIRRAGPADADGVLDCLQLAFEPYRDRYTAAAFEDTVLSAEAIARRFTEMCVLVATSEDGQIAGTIGYQIVDGLEGHVRGMAVLPAHLGSGVAKRLLEAVETDLRQAGCSRVSLDTTEPLQRAARFYERNGFRFSGIVRDFFGMRLLELTKRLD
jgi:ribosomal protein S18 acetylase RimI-like enzyme